MKHKGFLFLYLFLFASLCGNIVHAQMRDISEMRHILTSKEKAQLHADDNTLRDFFAKNNIKTQKTSSGLYYTITKEGDGNQITAGDTVSINYTGKLIDGKVFDSNTDSSAHPDPLVIEIGKGRIVKGMDEGVQLLKKGSKATIYLPSILAYSTKEHGNVPANSILIFDLEITGVWAKR